MKEENLENTCKKEHEERECGWTGQIARCDYASWWDCSFLCTYDKINPKKGLVACKYNVPDFIRCEIEMKGTEKKGFVQRLYSFLHRWKS